MNLIPQPTILDKATLAAAEAANHLASVMQSGWTSFWQRDSAEVLADIAADLPKTLAIFALNTQAGGSVNALLDAINDEHFPARAPVDLPPYWSFNGTAFEYSPPPAPEPEPEPEQPVAPEYQFTPQ
jgi:hypothetical protein